jgi:hypothetical protein
MWSRLFMTIHWCCEMSLWHCWNGNFADHNSQAIPTGTTSLLKKNSSMISEWNLPKD